ncbi:MAG: alpha/beta hydrolase [Desulfomicrobium sp.]|jgi:hypothetical protein|nr:alpha/beta hydrolase [Desulfomicrobium sp.]NLV96206.1 alpha/beta hydrolase [Desulfovibrionales bacterium]
MPWLFFFLIFICTGNSAAHGYEYPFQDPFVATVLGTPPKDQFQLSAVRQAGLHDLNPLHDLGLIRTKELLIHDRPVPKILWYDDTLRYSLALQRHPAPLLFVIAGTGSSYDSAHCRFLQKIFYRAGLHVVTLSSPTYANFVVSASSTQVPGYIPTDIADLYQCMEAIVRDLGPQRITSTHLTGYSLGGTQAAFLAELDSKEQRLGFDKIMLLNPAVSLITSATILDHLLSDNVANRAEAARKVADLVQELSEAYKDSNEVNFGDDFLFALHGGKMFTETDLQILIGVTFRVALANMVFASDVCTGAGYIVPRGHQIQKNETLSPYLDAAVGVSFEEYIEEYVLPYLMFQNPKLTAQQAIYACSLESIAPFLRQADHIQVLTNQDDFILTEGDMDFLQSTFGQRLTLYPFGGHCGNLRYKDNMNTMLNFFCK